MDESIPQKAKAALQDILDNEISVSSELMLEQIPYWSSLKYIQWISTLEDTFSVQFDTEEHQAFQSFGQVCESIARKLSS